MKSIKSVGGLTRDRGIMGIMDTLMACLLRNTVNESLPWTLSLSNDVKSMCQ